MRGQAQEALGLPTRGRCSHHSEFRLVVLPARLLQDFKLCSLAQDVPAQLAALERAKVGTAADSAAAAASQQ